MWARFLHLVTWPGIFLLTLGHLTLHAQDNTLVFEHYNSSASGLASSFVTTILQDRTGFIWLGTEQGVNRYDGLSTKLFRHDPKDPTRFEAHYVAHLLEDKQGLIWIIGYYPNAILGFNPATEEATSFHSGSLRQVFSKGQIGAIAADSSEGIWLGSENGISHYSPENDLVTSYSEIHLDSVAIEIENVLYIVVAPDGSTWFNVNDTGVARIGPDKQVIDFFDATSDTTVIKPGYIHPLVAMPSGDVWFATPSGFLVYDTARSAFQTIAFPSNLPEDFFISIAALGNDTTLWLGTAEHGLIHYRPETNTAIWHAHDPTRETSVNPGFINNLFIDESDVLWVATNSGLSKADLHRKPFYVVRQDPNQQNSLSNNLVLGIAEDPEGSLWVATSNGLNRRTKNGDTFQHFFHNSNDPGSIYFNDVWMVYTDRTGRVWSGAPHSETLNAWDPVSKTFIRYHHRNERKDHPPFHAFTMYEDRQDNLWIGSHGGLILYDRSADGFSLFSPDTTQSFPVRSILEDHYGTLWIGLEGKGLFSFDRETHAFHDHTPSEGVIFHSAVALLEDHQGFLWIGTHQGLFSLVRNKEGTPTRTFNHYGTTDGLSDYAIVGLLEDDLHRLWVSTTSGGLNRITFADEYREDIRQIRTFDIDDGLPSNTFFIGPSYESAEGLFYFGGDNGFVIFDPLNIHDNPIPPSTVLVDFKLFNKSVAPGPRGETQRTYLDQQISHTSEVTLSHSDQVFTIEFAGLHYAKPQKNEFEYRLLGFTDTWQPAGQHPRATYTNLNPGAYTFEVRSANADGIWNPSPTSLSIIITPPFWQTTWFRMLMMLAGIGFAASWYHWKTRSIRIQNQTLEKEVALRTEEIATKNLSLAAAYTEAQVINDNLIKTNKALEDRTDKLRDALETNQEILGITAHDLKNPLGGIIGLASMVLEDTKNGIQATYDSTIDNIPLLKSEAERMLKIITNLLDKHRQGENVILQKEVVILGDIVSAVIRWNKKQAQNKDITILYETNENLFVEVDVLAIQRVLDNYVSNAIKYSPPGSTISIQACTENSQESNIRVAVQDEGPGLTKEDMQKVFGKMQRLSAKPTGGEHSTGLGLFIVKLLVEAHGGTVGVDSVQGQGATFWFELPAIKDPELCKEWAISSS